MTPAAPATQRLYLEDARRKTALATVTGVASGGFLLDKTLYHTYDARYHHPQPCDRGHVLVEGHKLKVERVAWDARGRLVHRVGGPLPAPGAKAQLHLDADRRELQARAHTLMHFALMALAETRAEPVGRFEVVGGGEVRFAAKFREAPDAAASKLFARMKQLAESREAVTTQWMPRDEALARAVPQSVKSDEIAWDEPTIRIARIGDLRLPCDAPLVEHAWQVGEFKVAPPQPRRDGVGLRVKVVAA